MGVRIQQLPPVVANQIAAGEVIERPASVVKELLENSLDAGATSINIELSYGGLNQIKISDNGYGIVAEDLPLAVAAHATSKITKLDDLYAIESMGFRGEALASISSVAKVTISSRPVSQENAMMLRVQGNEQTLSPCARNIGTTIDVVDLFFNAPVRKRFLKGEKLEFQAIEQVVKRFALSAPDIALSLKHNGKLIFSLTPALTEQSKLARMSKILGSTFMSNALYLDVRSGNMALCGWLSSPEYQRSQNDKQWVYINQRMVKDKLINHALKQAYDGLLHPGRFPSCLLYFTMNSAELDVNVHPTKHEVRFQQPRLVHDFFTSHLAKALAKSNAKAFETACEPMAYSGEEAAEFGERYTTQSDVRSNIIPVTTIQSQKSAASPQVSSDATDSWSLRHETTVVPRVHSFENGISWTILNHQHILVFIKQQPYVVDALTLQQQWLQNQLKQSDLPLASRPLLVPVHYSPALINHEELESLIHALAQTGIKAELSPTGTLLIRSVPIQVPHLDIHAFLNRLVDSKVLQAEQILLLLCQSQILDLKYLSADERNALNQLLLDCLAETGTNPDFLVALTLEHCRMLFYV